MGQGVYLCIGFALELAVYTEICHTDLSDPDSGVPRPAGPVPPLQVLPLRSPPAVMHRATFSRKKQQKLKQVGACARPLGRARVQHDCTTRHRLGAAFTLAPSLHRTVITPFPLIPHPTHRRPLTLPWRRSLLCHGLGCLPTKPLATQEGPPSATDG